MRLPASAVDALPPAWGEFAFVFMGNIIISA